MTSIVLTIIGEDRPGLVQLLARTVRAHGANWEESRMARLAGRFAGILRVAVEEATMEALLLDLAGLEAQGLRVIAERSETAAVPGGRTFALDLVGNDRPGIVLEISRALADRGVNVEELETETSPAPMSGSMLFRCKARLLVPEGHDSAELRDCLEDLAADLIVDIHLQEG